MAGGRMSDPRKGGTFRVKPAPPKPTDERYRYRSRPTVPGPFGDLDEPHEGSLESVLERHADDEEAGLEPVIEYRVPGVTWAEWRRPLMLADLHNEGLARERTHMIRQRSGELREETRWEIDPEGWARLSEALLS